MIKIQGDGYGSATLYLVHLIWQFNDLKRVCPLFEAPNHRPCRPPAFVPKALPNSLPAGEKSGKIDQIHL